VGKAVQNPKSKKKLIWRDTQIAIDQGKRLGAFWLPVINVCLVDFDDGEIIYPCNLFRSSAEISFLDSDFFKTFMRDSDAINQVRYLLSYLTSNFDAVFIVLAPSHCCSHPETG
jgi:hypothetical protein